MSHFLILILCVAESKYPFINKNFKNSRFIFREDFCIKVILDGTKPELYNV